MDNISVNRLVELQDIIASTTQAASTKKTAVNEFSWVSYFILRDGSEAEKQKLVASVAKAEKGFAENPLFKSRGYVSNARTVLNHIEAGKTIKLKDKEFTPQSVTNDINTMLQFSMAVLRNAVNQHNLNEKREYETELNIFKKAIEIIQERTGKELSELKESFGKDFEQELLVYKEEARKAIEQEQAAKTSPFQVLKDTIAKCSYSELADIQGYVAELIASQEQEAEAIAA